jgi:hypothetical protein
METSEKITQLENEIKVLKNEIQSILLDIRENVLAVENPFSTPRPAAAGSQVVIEHSSPVKEQKDDKKPENPSVQPPKSASPDQPIQNVSPEQREQEQKPIEELPKKETIEIDPKNNGNVHKKGLEKTLEELARTDRSEIDFPRFEISESQPGRRQSDLVAYAGLACWVEESTRRLGRERTQALLDISEIAGYIPAEVKAILTKLTTIKSKEDSYKPDSRDYFESLVKIAALFGNDKDYNAALLLILSQGNRHG